MNISLLPQAVDYAADRFPDHEAVRFYDDSISYSDLATKTNRLARFLYDQERVAADELRSHLGCVVETPGPDFANFKYKKVPAGEYIWAQFKGSPAIGPVRVYPAVTDWMVRFKIRSGSDTSVIRRLATP